MLSFAPLAGGHLSFSKSDVIVRAPFQCFVSNVLRKQEAFPKLSVLFDRPVFPVVPLLPLSIFRASAILSVELGSFLSFDARLLRIVGTLKISGLFLSDPRLVSLAVFDVVNPFLFLLLLDALVLPAAQPRTHLPAIKVQSLLSRAVDFASRAVCFLSTIGA
jgi:hypothetical protein